MDLLRVHEKAEAVRMVSAPLELLWLLSISQNMQSYYFKRYNNRIPKTAAGFAVRKEGFPPGEPTLLFNSL